MRPIQPEITDVRRSTGTASRTLRNVDQPGYGIARLAQTDGWVEIGLVGGLGGGGSWAGAKAGAKIGGMFGTEAMHEKRVRATNPKRFVRGVPRPPELPTAAWINQPMTATIAQ